MDKVPFELHFKAIGPGRGTHTLLCTKLLRQIPGKRRVYSAKLQGRKVVAKIYESRLSGRCKLLREWRGLTRLAHKGVNAPRPLFYGRAKHRRWITVVQYLEDSATAVELYRNAESADEKLEVIEPLFTALARLNNAGIIQKDLHLGNFLLSRGKVFSLDTATMRFRCRAVSKKQSLRQLAILSWYVPQDLQNELPRLLKKYADVRGWEITDEDKKAIENHRNRHAAKEIKRQLKKTLRTSSRQIKVKVNSFNAVFNRELFGSIDVSNFLSEIDRLTETGRILKDRNTSFLSRVAINDREIVIKRYNHKGLLHSIRQSLKRSRAKRSWLHGHRLNMLGVNTPRPLAFIEKRIGSLLWTSYILTGYIGGRNLHEFLSDEKTTSRQKRDIKQKIHELMTTMHENRITHGDFKRTNFIVSEGDVYVTDLDAMKVHRFTPFFRRRRLKDTGRLERMFERGIRNVR